MIDFKKIRFYLGLVHSKKKNSLYKGRKNLLVKKISVKKGLVEKINKGKKINEKILLTKKNPTKNLNFLSKKIVKKTFIIKNTQKYLSNH